MEYVGDVNVEYGGTWYDMTTFDDGYVSCVRVTDLASAKGFDGAVMVEHLVVPLDKSHWKSALDCCGMKPSDLLAMDSDWRKVAICESLLSYGIYDPDDAWDGYRLGYLETLQTKVGGPMKFNGWKADKRVLSENLVGYLKNVHQVKEDER